MPLVFVATTLVLLILFRRKKLWPRADWWGRVFECASRGELFLGLGRRRRSVGISPAALRVCSVFGAPGSCKTALLSSLGRQLPTVLKRVLVISINPKPFASDLERQFHADAAHYGLPYRHLGCRGASHAYNPLQAVADTAANPSGFAEKVAELLALSDPRNPFFSGVAQDVLRNVVIKRPELRTFRQVADELANPRSRVYASENQFTHALGLLQALRKFAEVPAFNVDLTDPATSQAVRDHAIHWPSLLETGGYVSCTVGDLVGLTPLIMASAYEAAASYNASAKEPCWVFFLVDEYAQVAHLPGDVVPMIRDLGRSAHVGAILATQGASQLVSPQVGRALIDRAMVGPTICFSCQDHMTRRWLLEEFEKEVRLEYPVSGLAKLLGIKPTPVSYWRESVLSHADLRVLETDADYYGAFLLRVPLGRKLPLYSFLNIGLFSRSYAEFQRHSKAGAYLPGELTGALFNDPYPFFVTPKTPKRPGMAHMFGRKGKHGPTP